MTAKSKDGQSATASISYTVQAVIPLAVKSSIAPQQPPAITAASMTNRRFRVAKASTAVSAGKAPLGTSFQLHAVGPGEREDQDHAGRGRAAPRPQLSGAERETQRAHAKHCTRTLAVVTLTRASEPAGADKVAFSGRIGHSPAARQAPTRHLLSASNGAGSSMPVTAHLHDRPRLARTARPEPRRCASGRSHPCGGTRVGPVPTSVGAGSSTPVRSWAVAS